MLGNVFSFCIRIKLRHLDMNYERVSLFRVVLLVNSRDKPALTLEAYGLDNVLEHGRYRFQRLYGLI